MSAAGTLDRAARATTRAKPRSPRPVRPGASSQVRTQELLLSPGQPLPAPVQAGLEHALGHELSDVRIHDDAEAAALAEAAGAAAFVLGTHIFFAGGRYQPDSGPGQRLLAHEVAHVVQNRVAGAGSTGDILGCREAEADRLAEHVVAAMPERRMDRFDPSLVGDRAPTIGSPPDVELPALHYADAVTTAPTDTVKVVELLVRMIARTLRTDPEDRAGRVRAQLARLVPGLRDDVLSLARTTMPASDYDRLEAVAAKGDAAGAALSTPEVGADPDDVAASEPAATESAPPEPATSRAGQADATTHTHADGTTHSHVDTDDHHRGPSGLLGAIAAFFGGRPFLAFLGRATTPAGATAGTGADPARGSAPGLLGESTAAPAAGHAEENAAGPVAASDEDLAEGKAAPLVGPAKEATPAGPAQSPAAASPTPSDGPGAPIADPQAAKGEVASAVGAGPAAAAPTAAAGTAPVQGGSQPGDAAGQDQGGPEQQRIEAEDRTVLETHSREQEAGDPSIADVPATSVDIGVEAAEGDTDALPAAAPDSPDVQPPTGLPAAAEPTAETGSEPAQPGAETTAVASGTETAAAEPESAGSPDPIVPEPDLGAGAPAPEFAGAAAPLAGPETPLAEAGIDPEPVAADAEPMNEAGSVDSEPAGPGLDNGAESDVAGAGPEGAPGAQPAGGLAACMGGNPGATQPPTPDVEAPSGGCGPSAGGGGSAEPAPAAVPDVSASTPDAALATVGALPATDLQLALPQLGAAATAEVGKQREAMPPPTMERPSGASAALDVTAPIPQRPVTPYTGPSQSDKVGSPAGIPTPAPNLQPTPSPSAQQVAVATPRLGGDQPLTEADAAKVTESIDSVPTTDAELAVDAGAPGSVALEADADPALVATQRQALATQVGTVATQGAKDSAAPLGEADIRPHVPPKTLTATPDDGASCPGLGPAANKTPGGGSKYPKLAIDAIVAEKGKDDLRAGVAKAGADFGSARDKREADSVQARADSDAQMQDAVDRSNTEQVGLRRAAIGASTKLRTEWTGEQRAAVDTAVETSDTAARKGTGDAARLKREHEATAQSHVDEGNRQIREAREDAERKARAKKAEAKKKKGGILGWIGAKVASFFEGLKSAITGLFDLARSVVRKAIDGAKKLAHAAIELGRKAVVGAIKLAGDAIVAVGDVVLAAFPATRAKFREKVAGVVDVATRKVNEAADALERGIQKLLDALGRALDCALQYLKAGYLAAVDLLASVVKAVIDAAQQFLDLLAEWAGIVVDIARDPIGWLKGLGRSAIDGVRNCLWGALKRSIKQWFNDKVEEVVGVGKLILNVLIKGCLTFADIARMAWDGIKAALPGILIQLIIEKLVALIVPAAAALSLIIDGLKAAWGAASRILAAFGKFMAFLKAVRGGNGPGAFADLVAAAAVAVIEFISNFLVDRLKGAGKGVGNSLKSMAARIGKTLGRAGRAVGRGARAVGRGLMRGVRAGTGLVRRGAAAVVRGGRRVAGALARGARRVGTMLPRGVARVGRAVDPRRVARAIARSRLGQAVGGGWNRGKAFASRQRDKLKAKYDAWREKRKKTQKSPEERLAIAVTVIQPSLQSLIARGVSMVRLLLRRAYWWTRYGARVTVQESAGESEFEVRVNPKKKVARAYRLTGARLLAAIDKAVARLLARKDVSRASARMDKDIEEGKPARVSGGAAGFPAAVKAMRSKSLRNADAPRNNQWLIGRGKDAQTVKEFRPANYRSPGERMVQSIRGPYTPKEKGGRALDRWLSTAAGGRTTGDQRSARALQQMMRGKPSSVTPGQEGSLARTAMLLAGRESGGRSLRNVALAPMTVELVAKGELSWKDALNKPGYWNRPRAGEVPDLATGGAFPMSFFDAGASAAYREGDQATRDRLLGKHLPNLTAVHHAQREAELDAGVKELERRELALARRWLGAQNAADGGMRFRDAGHAETWVYEKLLKTYGLARDAVAATKAGKT